MSGEPVERPLSGGFSNVVVQVGRTVRRDTGPWTGAVHALLRHLEQVGFQYSPRVLGIDEQGREILSFIDGKTAWYFVPLRAAGGYQTDGFPTFAEQRRRLGVWCDELDVEPAAVLSAVRAVQAFERDRIAERGAAGIEPYAKFLARGDVAAIDVERAWLDAHHDALIAG